MYPPPWRVVRLMVDAGIKNRDIASLKAEMSQLKRENER